MRTSTTRLPAHKNTFRFLDFHGSLLHFVRVPALLLFALVVAGCASGKTYREDGTIPPVIGGKTLQNRLADSATQVSRAWMELAMLSRPSADKYGLKPHKYLSPAESVRISVRWTGPVYPVARKIAKAMGYRIFQMGNPGTWHPAVVINVKNVSAYQALNSLAMQLNPRGGIAIRNDLKAIEIYYQGDENNETPELVQENKYDTGAKPYVVHHRYAAKRHVRHRSLSAHKRLGGKHRFHSARKRRSDGNAQAGGTP